MLAAATDDLRKMKVRNRFLHDADNELSAIVESVVLWFDLVQRKPVVPPADLAALWRALARTDDFQTW